MYVWEVDVTHDRAQWRALVLVTLDLRGLLPDSLCCFNLKFTKVTTANTKEVEQDGAECADVG
jgi:hypothetical protein